MSSASRRLLAAVAAGGIVSTGAVLAPTAAYAATAPITSAGPLTRVEISDVLNCAVDHAGDTASEWYGQTACGTLLATGGTLFGPATIPAGSAAAPRTTWTPVSQSAVTGTGTNADPYKVVTVDDATGAGLRLTETDTYVVGEESYRTDIVVANTGAAASTATLYRAGDCYLQNSDFGYGAVDTATGAVTCTASNQPGARIEQMLPLTAGSHYYETFYGTVWSRIGQQLPFPDTCDCAVNQDNGLGLSWDVSLAAGASKTFSSLVTFSPLGRTPLTITKTADAASVPAGGTDGYTITVTNNNVSAVTLGALTDTIGAGFSYRAGSTSGATTADPAISGQTLTWSGIAVPAGGTATVHFGVTVAAEPGTYTDEAGGTAEGYTVVGTGPVAPVAVTPVVTPPANTPPTAAPVSVTTPQDTPVGVTLAGSDVDGDALAFAVATQPAHGTLSGTGANLTYTPAEGYTGPDTFTYTANDGHADSAPATVTITVTPVVTPTGPALDARVSADARHATGRLTAPALTTHAGNELVLAFVTADGPSSPTQRVTAVTGGGLTWTLVKRANATWGTTEVWQAYATAPLTGAVVRAALAKTGYDGSITVAAFSGAAAHAGASAATAARTGAPSATLTPTGAGSLVWATGHDWTHNTTPVAGAGQAFVHLFLDGRVHDSFWVQQRTAATTGPTPVTVNDTGLSRDRWQLVAVEIPAAS